jgi:hypothetical protein
MSVLTRALGLAEIRRMVGDDEMAKGSRLLDDGRLSYLARHEGRLFCEAQGTGGNPYRVSASFDDQGRVITRCSCPAARYTAVCKHAAGLLVAWARDPAAFVESEMGPLAEEKPWQGQRGGTVRRGTANTKSLLGVGVEQAAALARELAVTGVAGMGEERIGQLRDLAEQLRGNRLRRLGARTLELAELLERSTERPEPIPYADLLTDLVLTVRKLEKHLAGQPLEQRHEEELVGRSWRKNDRQPVSGLDLLEVGYRVATTADDFTIRESRFVDLISGEQYTEKQIVPLVRARYETPKPSYAGLVLRGAAGGLFPGFPPRRLYLESPGAPSRAGQPELERLLELASPALAPVTAAYQAYRRDVFAPDGWPVLVACERLYVRGGRMRAVDAGGDSLPLAAGRGLQQAMVDILRERPRLRAVLGELALDGVVTELHPRALLVEGETLSLRGLHAQPVRRAPTRRSWQEEARASGLPAVAVALGEVREQLATALITGLRALVPRVVDPLAARLRELGLQQPLPLLEQAVREPDPAQRLEPVVKVYVLLGIALVRLAGVQPVQGELSSLPGLPSVSVSAPSPWLEPGEAGRRVAEGTLSRYEAELHCARWYAERAPSSVYPEWADGLARPHLVRALLQRPAQALVQARGVLETDPGRAARQTAYLLLESLADPAALQLLEQRASQETDAALASWAHRALERKGRLPDRGRKLAEGAAKILSDEILGGSRLADRTDAMRDAVACGALECLPALRQVFHGDPSAALQREAMLALAGLGDAEVVDDLVQLLDARASVDERDASAAARALGRLGDARGLGALLRALEAGFAPNVVLEALGAAGHVAVEPLMQRVAAQPELAGRAALKSMVTELHGPLVGEAIARQLEALAGEEAPAAVTRWLKLASLNGEALRPALRAALALAERLEGKLGAAVRKKLPAWPDAEARAAPEPAPRWWTYL